jgi:hypothetical protein
MATNNLRVRPVVWWPLAAAVLALVLRGLIIADRNSAERVARRAAVAETVARIKSQKAAERKAAETIAGAVAVAGAAEAIAKDRAGAAGF